MKFSFYRTRKKKENINENEITTIFRTEKSTREKKISLEKQDLLLKGINENANS